MKFHSLLLGVSAGTLGFSGIAASQETSSQPAAAPRVVLEEVVVTAERRTESLQTTAIAATVLSGQELANRGTNIVDQLQFIVPSTTVNNFGQGIDFNIRGIGKGEHNTQTGTGVITYRDSVASFPGYFTEEPYYDIARVEVLRGPQGTFAGQNATGGAVFVTSNDPVIGGGHQGYFQSQLGNYSNYGLQGAINLPVNDSFAARIAVNGEARDSFYNISGPWTGSDGKLRSGSARLGLLWQPSDSSSVLFKTDYNYIDMGAYPADQVLATNDMFDIAANSDLKALDRFGRVTLKIDHRFSSGTTLRSVSGYQDGNTAYRADLDGTDQGYPPPATNRRWGFRDSVDETIYSQEFNLISSDSGSFQWVVGAYYQSNDYDFPAGEFVIDTFDPLGIPAATYVLAGTNKTWNAAGFGQVTYDFASGFQLQFGTRYSDAHTSNVVHVMQYGTPIDDQQSASYSNWSGKVALNWTVNDQNFLYAFYATGYKPGGLNVPVGFGLPAPFDKEEVKSAEIGWKSRTLNGHVHAQLNAYYNNYDKFQVIVAYPAFPVFGFELNVPDTTTIYGFEAQIQAAFGNFSIDGGVGTTDSSLGKFYAVDPRAGVSFVPCDPKTGPETARCINLKGQDQTYAPDFTFNLGTQYEFTFGGGDTLTPRLSYAHVSQQWATLFEDRTLGDRIEARNIWNAQVAWMHGKFVTTLFGTNITDEHYVGAINSGLRFAGLPRQFGLRMMKTF
jgi:iron complex outermembrane receptor protein